MEYKFDDINEAFAVVWQRMWSDDEIMERPSRNGPVREVRGVMNTTYTNPRQRVLFCPVRDANPFFHLFEAIWMLAGRDDLAFLTKFNKQMEAYSDDGIHITGSNYGMRWDRPLSVVVNRLRKDRDSRRTYVPIFKPADVTIEGRDMPCNLGATFYIRDGRLDMTVFNRSNDMVWGAYGSNVVTFSLLQEYVACLLGVALGDYHQISTCFHLYTEFDITKRLLSSYGKASLPAVPTYESLGFMPSNITVMNSDDGKWQHDATVFLDVYTDLAPLKTQWHDDFFAGIVAPMYRAWYFHKQRDVKAADDALNQIQADDRQFVARQWIEKRRRLSAARADKRGEKSV